MFTGSLSIAGLALAGAEGILPIKTVTATSVYGMETEPPMPTQSRELVPIARRHTAAHRRTVERLQIAAHEAGADAVLGVQLTRRVLEKDVFEWTLIGTAVQTGLGDRRHPPMVTTLSAQECSLLTRQGLRPAGMVFGMCVYGQCRRTSVQRKLQMDGRRAAWEQVNGERKDYTDGLKKAQHQAMARMRDEAAGLHADGVLGVRLDKDLSLRDNEGCLVSVSALGNAVVAFGGNPPAITCAVPLSASRS